MSTDDRLTMALYNAEQRKKREQPDPERVAPAPEGHKPIVMPTDRMAAVERACAVDDSCISAGTPADAQARPTCDYWWETPSGMKYCGLLKGHAGIHQTRRVFESESGHAQFSVDTAQARTVPPTRPSRHSLEEHIAVLEAELAALRASVSPDAGSLTMLVSAEPEMDYGALLLDFRNGTLDFNEAYDRLRQAAQPDAGTLREMQREAFMAGWAAYHHELDPDHECAAWLAQRPQEPNK